MMHRGGSRIFIGGGGGAKTYVRERPLRARNPKSLSAGFQGPPSKVCVCVGGGGMYTPIPRDLRQC